LRMEDIRYPDHFEKLLEFLCQKYDVERTRVFVEYSPKPPPPLKGTRAGYYDGLLSFREKDDHAEFLITVFEASHEPLLTLAHEFEHLVKNLKSGNPRKQLAPPDHEAERLLDEQAQKDLAEFRESIR
jgi:hypothetical protein